MWCVLDSLSRAFPRGVVVYLQISGLRRFLFGKLVL